MARNDGVLKTPVYSNGLQDHESNRLLAQRRVRGMANGVWNGMGFTS